MLFLNAEDVNRSLPMAQAIECMKDALRAISDKSTNAPQRLHLNVQPHDNTLLVMPAVIDASVQPGFTLKVASVCPNNPNLNLPRVESIVIAFNSETGQPIALLDGKAITAIRTAATSAAATSVLAREESRCVAVFGAGVLARSHVQAMLKVRRLDSIKLYSRTRSKLAQLSKWIRQQCDFDGEIIHCEDPGSALANADIVCTVTSAKSPVFKANQVPSGCHINAVGGYAPAMAEIPGETMANARVFVEQLESALSEAGELAIPIRAGLMKASDIAGEIGNVLSGTLPGRTNDQQITVFKSVGNANEDAFAVSHAVRHALANDIGQRFDWQ
jgi:ornithine cyclodeaminase/alanine dehydrogenase-like protein (mu-crystallin family)